MCERQCGVQRPFSPQPVKKIFYFFHYSGVRSHLIPYVRLAAPLLALVAPRTSPDTRAHTHTHVSLDDCINTGEGPQYGCARVQSHWDC